MSKKSSGRQPRRGCTLMTQMGIGALAPQPGTSQRNPQHEVYPYLLRNLPIVRSNQVWALDITYIRMERGFVYLRAVVDVYSRRILAHRVAITLEAIHAKEVRPELRTASVVRRKRRPPPWTTLHLFKLTEPLLLPVFLTNAPCFATVQAVAQTLDELGIVAGK